MGTSDQSGFLGVGFSAQPDRDFLETCAPVLAAADFLEVLPEGLIAPTDAPGFHPNGFLPRIEDLQQRLGVPLVAHGVGLSVAGSHPLDAGRLDRWVARAAALHDRLGFAWYTDHWGITAPAGLNLTLPLAPPLTDRVREAARARLGRLRDALGVPVGVENSVFYAPMYAPEHEAAFLGDVLAGGGVLLLDVHNLYTHQQNLGLDVDAWLDAAPLDRVVEIHVSGGVDSDPRWLGGPTLRLDSHDDGVPEPVWALLAAVIGRCPNLRGVVLERLEGTVEPHQVDGLLAELERVRAVVSRARTIDPAPAVALPPRPPIAVADPVDWELIVADAWTSADPRAALEQAAEAGPGWLSAAIGHALAAPHGIEIAERLLARLRFERLVQGSGHADTWFAEDPAGFTRAFRRYCAEVPPTAFLPADEAALFARWSAVAAPRG